MPPWLPPLRKPGRRAESSTALGLDAVGAAELQKLSTPKVLEAAAPTGSRAAAALALRLDFFHYSAPFKAGNRKGKEKFKIYLSAAVQSCCSICSVRES